MSAQSEIHDLLMDPGVLKNADASKLADNILDVALDELKQRTAERDKLTEMIKGLQSRITEYMEERDAEKGRADKAERCCAEMRDAFKEFECELCDENHKWTPECEACLSGEPDHCTCCNNEPEDCPCCMVGEYANSYKILRHALSPDCGKDYVPRGELDAASGCLAHTEDALIACEKASGFVPGDTSLPDWIYGLKERSELASLKLTKREAWWEQRYDKVVKERDAAKAEVERLRGLCKSAYSAIIEHHSCSIMREEHFACPFCESKRGSEILNNLHAEYNKALGKDA